MRILIIAIVFSIFWVSTAQSTLVKQPGIWCTKSMPPTCYDAEGRKVEWPLRVTCTKSIPPKCVDQYGNPVDPKLNKPN